MDFFRSVVDWLLFDLARLVGCLLGLADFLKQQRQLVGVFLTFDNLTIQPDFCFIIDAVNGGRCGFEGRRFPAGCYALWQLRCSQYNLPYDDEADPGKGDGEGISDPPASTMRAGDAVWLGLGVEVHCSPRALAMAAFARTN